MFDKLHSYPKYFIFLTGISLLFALPTFATTQKAKTQAQNTTQAQNQSSKVEKLTTFNTEVAYKIWMDWYKAQSQGARLPEPTISFTYEDEKDFDRLSAMWNEGQQKAYKNFVRIMEQKAKVAQQTQQQSNPGQNTVKLEKFDTNVAYKIWTQYYQAQEKGLEPSLPVFDVSNNTKQEAKRLMAIWNKGAEKAKQEAEQRREDARTGKTSFQAKPVTPLVSDALPTTQAIPVTNTLPHLNQRPKGMAGISAFTMNPTSQPGQIQVIQNAQNNVILNANNSVNRSIAEQNKENISYNVAKAKELINIAYPLAQTSGVTTQYLTDHNNPTGLPQVVEELQNGQVVRQYTYGVDGLISMRQLINSQWVVSFFIKDGQGSVRMLTDVNGNVTDTYDYDAYGNLIAKTGNTPNTRLYNGEEFDEDLGFYYLRARFLDTIKGRFLTQDSFEGEQEQPLSLHKYLYAHADPVNNFDPSGHQTISGISGDISGLLGLASLPTFQLPSTTGPLSTGAVVKPTKFKAGPLWGNREVTDAQRKDVISAVDQLVGNASCTNWFKTTIKNIFQQHGGNLEMFPSSQLFSDDLATLFSNTGINFYKNPSDFQAFSTLPRPSLLDGLSTSKISGLIMQTIGRGTPNAQVTISRAYFENPHVYTTGSALRKAIATDLVHEMFHVSGMHRGSSPRLSTYTYGIVPALIGTNDLAPEIRDSKIESNCSNTVK